MVAQQAVKRKKSKLVHKRCGEFRIVFDSFRHVRGELSACRNSLETFLRLSLQEHLIKNKLHNGGISCLDCTAKTVIDRNADVRM